MSLDQDTQQWLSAQPAFDPLLPIDVLRKATDEGLIAQQSMLKQPAEFSEFYIEADDGHTVQVRMYVPDALTHQHNRPAMVFAHGGRWCLGSLDAWNTPCQQLAEATSSVVFSVDYRLAPEHPFPVPLQDFYTAFCRISARANELGLDAKRIALSGESAGGNLAAAACLLAQERAGPPIARQLLLYPALDPAMISQGYKRYAAGFGLTKVMMDCCWQAYLPRKEERSHPLASPLHADTLMGLPDALVIVCEHDPLRDEAEEYARQLDLAGVRVRCELAPGTVHGAMHMTGISSASLGIYKTAALLWHE